MSGRNVVAQFDDDAAGRRVEHQRVLRINARRQVCGALMIGHGVCSSLGVALTKRYGAMVADLM
jgi:hypothetical protein